jgi:hypothetical protein
VKARTLIGHASFGPDQIKILTKAFDEAWGVIAPNVSARADAIEVARYRLASTIIGLAKHDGLLDAVQLRDRAVELHADLTGLRRRS